VVSTENAVRSGSTGIYDVTRMDGCHLDLEELRNSLDQVLEVAGVKVPHEAIQLQWQAVPHKRPSSLPAGKQAVYVFFIGQRCMKVGKAGPKSGPRYVSHHYFCKAPSTLAKSILGSRDQVLAVLEAEKHKQFQDADEVSIGKWIEQSTARLNVLLPAKAGPHALSLVEAFLQCRLQPIFEG
jgi:hypothetical protein